MADNLAPHREPMAPVSKPAKPPVRESVGNEWSGTPGEKLLSDLAHAFWNASGFLRHNDVHLEIRGGEVVLCGIVASWYEKQLAQETLREVSNTGPIRNLIEVQPRLVNSGNRSRKPASDRRPKELV
jgi:hypothetical protein